MPIFKEVYLCRYWGL